MMARLKLRGWRGSTANAEAEERAVELAEDGPWPEPVPEEAMFPPAAPGGQPPSDHQPPPDQEPPGGEGDPGWGEMGLEGSPGQMADQPLPPAEGVSMGERYKQQLWERYWPNG